MCAASREVVLDVAREQGVGAIMKSFCRFVSRKGFPDKIVSDHRSNFTAEERQNLVVEILGLIVI